MKFKRNEAKDWARENMRGIWAARGSEASS